MTDKEIYELIKTHGYEPDNADDVKFSDSGKLYPNEYIRFQSKILSEDVENYISLPVLEICINKNLTNKSTITFNAVYLHDDSLTDEDDNTNYILSKEFEDVVVETINRDKLIKILNQNNKVFKEIKVRIKKYKIKEGF